MSQYIEFTPEQLQALGDMYAAGHSTHKLGKRYGISATTVMRRLTAMGIQLRPLRANRIATDEVVRKAEQMRAEDKQWRAIEKATGVKRLTIMAAIRRRNGGK